MPDGKQMLGTSSLANLKKKAKSIRKRESDQHVASTEADKVLASGQARSDQKPKKIKGKGCAPGGQWVIKAPKKTPEGTSDGKITTGCKEATGSTSNSEEQGKKKAKAKNKYVLFIGNLPYETTENDVRRHFRQVGE